MKKGLILALLMVAMVAMVLPAGAKAPIVNPLPTVIVGDADDLGLDGATTKTLMRYYNAFALSGQYVKWNNDDSYTSDLFHAYYFRDAASETAVKMYNDSAAIAPLTLTEKNNLVNSGIVPAAATRLTSATADGTYQYFKANFFDADLHDLADPKNATVANGYAYDATSTYSKQAELTLICGVTSGTKLVLNAGSADVFTVFCTKNVADSMQGGLPPVVTYDFSDSGNRGLWGYDTSGNLAAIPAPTKVDSSAGIGFNTGTAPLTAGQLGTVGAMFAKWYSPLINVSAADAGMVYRAKANLVGNSTVATAAPGFRFSVQNWGVSHAFYTQSKGLASVDGVFNVPLASAPYDARLYWEVPLALGDMGDSGVIATGRTEGDYRDYIYNFELLALATQYGQMTMTTMEVVKFARPGVVAPMANRSWGTPKASNPGRAAGLAFNAAGNAWVISSVAGTFTWDTVNSLVTANDATIGLGTGAATRYLTADSPVIQAAANRLYRFSAELTINDQKLLPRMRFLMQHHQGQRAQFVQRYLFNTGTTFKRTTVTGGRYAGQINCPMAPALTSSGNSSLVELYFWSHNQSTTLTDNTMGVSVQMYESAAFDADTYAGGGWDKPNGLVKVNYAGWEDLGTEF